MSIFGHLELFTVRNICACICIYIYIYIYIYILHINSYFIIIVILFIFASNVVFFLFVSLFFCFT